MCRHGALCALFRRYVACPYAYLEEQHDLGFLCGDRRGGLCPAEGPSSAQGATERQQLFRFESGLSQSPRWGRGWRV